MTQKMKSPIYTRTAKIWLDEHGICRFDVQSGKCLELEDAREAFQAVLSLCDGSLPSILIDVRYMQAISKEAREFFSQKDNTRRIALLAFLVDSPLSTLLVNFYIGLNPPGIPTKLFTQEEEAIQWLKGHRS